MNRKKEVREGNKCERTLLLDSETNLLSPKRMPDTQRLHRLPQHSLKQQDTKKNLLNETSIRKTEYVTTQTLSAEPRLPRTERNTQLPAAKHRRQKQRRQQHSSSTGRDRSHAQQGKHKQQTQNCGTPLAAPRSLDGGGHSARAAAPTWFPHAPKEFTQTKESIYRTHGWSNKLK